MDKENRTHATNRPFNRALSIYPGEKNLVSLGIILFVRRDFSTYVYVFAATLGIEKFPFEIYGSVGVYRSKGALC